MNNVWTAARVLILMGLRNLTSHKVKSTIVGSIMVFGTMLVVVGMSLLDSIEASMEKVVTSSLAGHLQVYSSQGRDELSLFGGLTASQPDIGEIEHFALVREVIESVDNVKAVVPMGVTITTGSGGNEIDRVLSRLREAVRQSDAARMEELSMQVRQLVRVVRKELDVRAKISSDEQKIAAELAILTRVDSDAFWRALASDAQKELLYLDTKLAPLAHNSRIFFIRALGTNPTQFQKYFDRFKITNGVMIPPGKKGILLSDFNYNRQLKHKIARQLDELKRKVEFEGKVIDEHDELKGDVRRMSRQHRRILLQLDADESKKLEAMLTRDFPHVTGDLETRVQAFLSVNTSNFDTRYAYFYKNIAPMLELYRVKIGDVVTLQGFTRRGYIKSVNVKVYGTFEFKGLEDSDLAGVVNIMDMLTWRELYGKMTEEQRKELEEIRDKVGLKDVSRDRVEDDLFGASDDHVVTQDSTQDGFDEFSKVVLLNRDKRVANLEHQTFTRQELEAGVALHAAIVLHDRSKMAKTRALIERSCARHGLKLKVVNWQEASGIVGQLIVVIRLVLYIAIVIIFLVALVIINNSMVMATMERVSEIGAMRAIGAKRSFILFMFLFETFVLGMCAGGIGALGGVGIISLMGAYGVPATSDIMRFIFAGSRLYPTVALSHVVFAMIVIFIVSVISTLYPAIVATRIQPVVAMRQRE